MPTGGASAKDDKLTIIAISALACILQDLLHEGLGHGVTAWLSGARSVTMSTVASAIRHRNAMDLGQWYAGQSRFRGDLLARPAKRSALPAGDSLLSGAGPGGKSIYGHRILLLFRRLELWRLGGRDPGSASALDVAAWARAVRRGVLLCVHAVGKGPVAAIPWRCGESTKISRAVLDAIFHGWNSGGSRRPASILLGCSMS